MKNLKELAKSIFLDSLRAADPGALLRQKVRVDDEQLFFNDEVINLNLYDEIVLIGFGKASLTMGAAMEDLLCDKIKRGILVTNRRTPQRFISEVIVAGHPTPDENSLLAGKRILSVVETATNKTLIIFLISGGGSSLVELPLAGISLRDLQSVNKTLVESGATIQEINIVRKKLSRIKGGRLAAKLGTSTNLAIYLSDVNAGDLSSLASGPLIQEAEHHEQFRGILERYNLLEKVPASIAEILQSEFRRKRQVQSETELYVPMVSSMLLLENRDLLELAAQLATEHGVRVEICSTLVEGHYREVADALIERLREWARENAQATVGLLSGGEVECAVKGKGIGGRNQEFVLYSATRIAEIDNDWDIVILSGGTDGIDGVSCAAGALIGRDDSLHYSEAGFDAPEYIQQNDSHSFLKQTGGLIMTGPTGNNVRDVRILLARRKNKGEKT